MQWLKCLCIVFISVVGLIAASVEARAMLAIQQESRESKRHKGPAIKQEVPVTDETLTVMEGAYAQTALRNTREEYAHTFLRKVLSDEPNVFQTFPEAPKHVLALVRKRDTHVLQALKILRERCVCVITPEIVEGDEDVNLFKALAKEGHSVAMNVLGKLHRTGDSRGLEALVELAKGGDKHKDAVAYLCTGYMETKNRPTLQALLDLHTAGNKFASAALKVLYADGYFTDPGVTE